MKKNDQMNDGLNFGKTKFASGSVDKTKKKVENNKSPIQQSTVDKYSLIPEDFKYENKHYKYIKYTKNDPANTYKVSCVKESRR